MRTRKKKDGKEMDAQNIGWKAESKTELRRIFVVAEDNLKSAGRIR